MKSLLKKILILTIAFTAYTNVASADLLTNLQAYYKLDEASGNASDSSGNGYTLTNNGTLPYAAALINNGGSYDATAKFLNLDSNLGVTNNDSPISISFWFKLKSEPASGSFYQFIYWTIRNGANENQYAIYYYLSGGVYHLITPGGDSTGALGTTNWYHVVFTYDGTNQTTYINGTQTSNLVASAQGGAGSSVSYIELGRYRDGNDNILSRYPNAYIDEVGLWSRTLTSGEVTSLYNGGAGLAYPLTVSTVLNWLSNFFMFGDW